MKPPTKALYILLFSGLEVIAQLPEAHPMKYQ